jgi:hypothetical protein
VDRKWKDATSQARLHRNEEDTHLQWKPMIQTRDTSSNGIRNLVGTRGSRLDSRDPNLIFRKGEAFLCLNYEGERCDVAPVQKKGGKSRR